MLSSRSASWGTVRAEEEAYYTTAEPANVTDPDLIYAPGALLRDAAGHYDDFEVERVVAVQLNPHANLSDSAAAIERAAAM